MFIGNNNLEDYHSDSNSKQEPIISLYHQTLIPIIPNIIQDQKVL
jgi:hypothetical protein